MTSQLRGVALIIAAGALGGAAIAAALAPPFQRWLPAYDRRPADAKSTDVAGPAGGSVQDANAVSGSPDYDQLMADLEEAAEAAADLPGYTATLERQVATGGELRNKELIDLKVRREPFSVYMRWRHKDQEVIYVDGQNDGRMIAKPAVALPFRRTLRLDPNSSLALQGCRYPVTEIGVGQLVRRVSEFYQGRSDRRLECTSEAATVDGRAATRYRVIFESPETSPDYSASDLVFDNASQLLVGVVNHGWKNDGTADGPVERYIYHNVDPTYSPSDVDFTPDNPAYGFSG